MDRPTTPRRVVGRQLYYLLSPPDPGPATLRPRFGYWPATKQQNKPRRRLGRSIDVGEMAVAVQSAASISRVLALSVSVLARHFPIFFLVGTISILPPLLLRRLLGSEQIFDGSPAAVVEWLVYALLTRLLLTIGECTVIMPTAFQALRRQPANFVNSLKAGLPRVIPVILIELITVCWPG